MNIGMTCGAEIGSTEEEEEVEDGSRTAASLIATWRGATSRGKNQRRSTSCIMK
jgi:hypothetical protein